MMFAVSRVLIGCWWTLSVTMSDKSPTNSPHHNQQIFGQLVTQQNHNSKSTMFYNWSIFGKHIIYYLCYVEMYIILLAVKYLTLSFILNDNECRPLQKLSMIRLRKNSSRYLTSLGT